MAEGDFSVFAKIQADTSNFEKGMKKAQTSANNLSNTFANVSKVITKALSLTGIVVGTKAIVDFGKASVQSANQAIKQFNLLDNTIKATGADAWTSTKELENMAKSLSDDTNYSVIELEKMQSVLLGFRDITDNFDEASEAVLDMATVMGMDLTSAVQTVGKALDDPVKGLDSLRRQGFAFTDEQKAELKQLVATGKKMEAQKIILDELSKSYGGASKAGQDSFAKQKHAVENFQDTLGTKLIPLVKVFAEDNARMINSLRDLIEKTDFTPALNVITNLKKMVSETFETISGYAKSVGNEISDFINRFNFKPIISVIDTLAGVFITMFNTVKNNSGEMIKTFQTIKETLISFSNSETFQNIANGINTILEALYFLWDKVETVATEIRKIVVDRIIEIWGKIKEFFNNSQSALANSEGEIKSWVDFFWYQFDNVFKVFQDLMNQISAIIHGDWAVAWEYAKLVVLRIIDAIVTGWDTLFKGFSDKMHKIITIASLASKVLPGIGIGGKAVTTALQGIEALSSGIGKGNELIKQSIEKTENKIEELSGHTADVSIRDLGKITEAFAGFTSTALGEIENLTDGVANETEKQKDLFKKSAEDGVKDSYKAYNEWDAKLLQQRIENLEEHGKEYSEEYLELTNQLIDMERQKALESADTEEERAKINEYYDKKIIENERRFGEERKKHWRENLNAIIGFMKNFASTAINVFKKVASGIKNAISGIGNFFKNLFSFNTDDALDELLKFEDAILTFFVETLPKLPGFFESAIQSIVILIKNVLSLLDFNQISNIIESIIKAVGTLITTISQYINQNAEKLTRGFSQLVQTVIKGISDWIKSGGWKELLNAILTIQKMIEDVVTENLPAIVDTIIEMLPDLIDTLIASIVSASKAVAKIIRPIIKLILALIDAIIEVLTSDEVMDTALDAIMELTNAIFEELIPGILKLIPKLIVKVIAQIIKNFPKIVKSLVQGLIKAFMTTNWAEVVKQIFMGFIDAFKDLFGIHSPSTLFESFGQYMIEGLWNGIKNMGQWLNDKMGTFFSNMVSGVGNAFANIGEGIKGAFENVWANIQSVFNNVGNWFYNIFSQASNGIRNAFNGIGEWFRNLWEGFANAMKTPINSVISGINEMITQMNKISVTIPSWVPAIGGRTFGINLSKLNYLATGTQNAQKGLAIVGEAGPELVKFNGGEQVLNNRNTNKAIAEAGKSTNNFNVTFNNLQDTTAYAMMQQLKQYNRQMAINGVI